MIGIPSGDGARQWSIEAAEHVAAAVDRQTRAEEQVMTLWPGYLLSSHASVYPRFENHFGFSASQQVSRAEQRQFALPSEWYVKNEISNRNARVVLTHPRLGPGYVGEALRNNGYRIVEEVEGVRIWLRQEQVGEN